jgi:hypothetical protein
VGALYRQRSKESVHEAKEFRGERHTGLEDGGVD